MKPVNMGQNDLLEVLDDIRSHVAAGDSFEGSIEYSIPEDENAPPRTFDVRGAYRIGNSMGQGGMRLVGEVAGEVKLFPPPTC